jgi:hypothetical protein
MVSDWALVSQTNTVHYSPVSGPWYHMHTLYIIVPYWALVSHAHTVHYVWALVSQAHTVHYSPVSGPWYQRHTLYIMVLYWALVSHAQIWPLTSQLEPYIWPLATRKEANYTKLVLSNKLSMQKDVKKNMLQAGIHAIQSYSGRFPRAEDVRTFVKEIVQLKARPSNDACLILNL